MIQAWRLMQAELVARIRDKSFWLEAFLLPLVVTGIMGLALSGVGHGKMPTIRVGLVTSSAEALAPSVLEIAYKASDSIKVEVFQDADQARSLLKGYKLDALVLVPDADSSQAPQGTLKATVESNRTTQFQAGMVAQITEATLRAVAAETGARAAVAEVMSAASVDPSPAWAAPTPVPVSAKLEQIPLKRFDVLGAQFAGLAVFFSILSTFRLMTNIFGDHRRGLNLRLSGLPVRAVWTAAGFIGTVALVACLQTVTVLALGRLAFDVSWGELGLLIIAVVIASLASAAVALVLAALPLSGSARGLVGTLFVLGGSVLGGSLVPLDNANATLTFFARGTLHYWVTSLLTGLSRGLSASEVWGLFAGVVAYGLAALALASLFLKRRRLGHA